ncbi:hypothetical protein EA187_00740 [Lujinxingia sediminis]|uniref:Flp family type IVb pilin n=1 Tax=Lujinxingia sediminis TaxID=2480984 RepID=A0ABY0CWC4_9DELT|nr:hypothetical protein [Lujinxingia sediminis]RVU47994.1 hypothetical protein EA187_00740 [Lujinxingia sediminis]
MMRRIRSAWERTPVWLGRGRGATAAEYMVLLMLAALFIVAMIRVFGSSVTSKFEASRQEISQISSEDRGDSAGSSHGAAGATNTSQRSVTRTTAASTAAADARARGERPDARLSSVGGVSWVVVAIVLGLFGLLGYVIFGGKKE